MIKEWVTWFHRLVSTFLLIWIVNNIRYTYCRLHICYVHDNEHFFSLSLSRLNQFWLLLPMCICGIWCLHEPIIRINLNAHFNLLIYSHLLSPITFDHLKWLNLIEFNWQSDRFCCCWGFVWNESRVRLCLRLASNIDSMLLDLMWRFAFIQFHFSMLIEWVVTNWNAFYVL